MVDEVKESLNGNNMILDIEREFTKEEAKEMTCVMFNVARLRSRPERKLSDVFRFCIIAVIWIVCAILFFGFFIIRGDRDALVIAGAILTLASIVFLMVFASRVYQMYDSLMKRGAKHVIIKFDENGIDYEEVGSRRFQTTWDTVSFVRAFETSIYIFPKELTGLIYIFEKPRYYEEFKRFLTENNIGVRVVE